MNDLCGYFLVMVGPCNGVIWRRGAARDVWMKRMMKDPTLCYTLMKVYERGKRVSDVLFYHVGSANLLLLFHSLYLDQLALVLLLGNPALERKR
jgi:hypothetical protein